MSLRPVARVIARALPLLPLLVAVLPCAAGPAFAGPPTSPRDHLEGAVRLRSNTFLAGWTYDDAGKITDDAGFVTETVSAQVEANVAPRLTLGATAPFVWIPEREAPSSGDVVVGGALSLLDENNPVDLALALDLKLPTYTGAPARRARAADGLPAVGDGQVDVTAATVLVAGLPLGGALQLYAGYRFRTGNVTDGVVGGGRLGLWFFDKALFVSVLLDTVVTFDAAEGSGEIVGRGYAAGGPRVSLRLIEQTYLELTALYVGRGQNTAGGAELGLGLSMSF